MSEPTSSPDIVRWATDAPERWPTLETAPLPQPGDLGGSGTNVVFFAAELRRAFAEVANLDLAQLLRQYLEPEGVLEVPIVIDDEGTARGVFLYSEAGPIASGHYRLAQGLCRTRGLETVYFAPQPLEESAADVAVLCQLEPRHFAAAQSDLPSAHYAMWWPSEGDSDLGSSPTSHALGRIYRALDRMEPWALGFLLDEWGYLEEHGPVKLPEELQVVPRIGPEGVPLLFSFQREKGLRFHLPVEGCTPRYRDVLLAQLAELFTGFRGAADQGGLPEIPHEQGSPADWWQLTVETVRQLRERGEPIGAVGAIPV